MFHRQKKTWFLLCGFLLALALLVSKDVWARLPLKAENLRYDVKVFNLFHTLQIRMEVRPADEENLYIARLHLQPKGVFKVVLPYKSCAFYSKLRLLTPSNRLRPEYFEKILVSKRVYRGVYRYDYEKGEVTGQGFFDDQPMAVEVFSLPSEPEVYYDDFLSFIYNLRSGWYGQLKPGEKVQVHTVPTRGKRVFDLEIANKNLASTFHPVDGSKYLMVLNMNKKVFGFHIDRFFIWLSDEYLPLMGIFRNVVGWGDIVGTFRGSEDLT
jgi:hypothetical protein